jgi:ADP-dependent phosphofructokinase/glucokinase
MTQMLETIRNLQARIIYAQRDGNQAEVLLLKKELEKLK